ncbi:hypothetical protein [Microcella frigidaquae]|uniref:Uncharacterized protein n=1 Tax=Microcella frigidaquae TaxID=424758 RepID=A0A840XFU1_9MICO|nr:hypothetical protein [Microcella frigidaquae]MBB5617206.1 hypothetical protein [Microcella frigidaquae]NHN45093.1 hypothetical protein [Microcella frigidaquae]
MAVTLVWSDVSPFLPGLSSAQTTIGQAWLPVLVLHLDKRYGSHYTDALKPAFASAAADAIRTRLDRPGMVLQQAISGASVRYSDRAALLSWFQPEQLAELDMLCGLGTVRSVRTPAPDGQRFGNLARAFVDEEELVGGDVVGGS